MPTPDASDDGDLSQALREFDKRLAETEKTVDNLADAASSLSEEQLARRGVAKKVEQNREAIELLQQIAGRLIELVDEDIDERQKQLAELEDAAASADDNDADENLRGFY